MHPRLFEIPIIHWPVGTYGPMLVIGFLAAITLIRQLSRTIKTDPEHITNAALYALIGGVVGARAFYVIHYIDRYRDDWLDVFKVWHGGLELLGGVIAAVTIILIYMIYHKLDIRRHLDILAIGLMLALVFGRIGCFLNGCCFGKPTDLPCAVRFPYDSYAYNSQVNPDLKRNRTEPYLTLPSDYFTYIDEKDYGFLKPFNELSAKQQIEVLEGRYRCLPVHPTQLYSSACAAFLCLLLYLFWRRNKIVWWLISIPVGIIVYLIVGSILGSGVISILFGFICGMLTFLITYFILAKISGKPGCTFGLMLILYGIMRFIIEILRDDNPFEHGWWLIYDGGTVSQNLGIYMVILGIILLIIFLSTKSKPLKV
ncbi:MAG: prolipoprotein diacylglyceryl transferase [Sedimentisphaerales bacterium]|nr:prolipoprotein diacylglyceryl transferase [Sedimentisphaerales bacterium]